MNMYHISIVSTTRTQNIYHQVLLSNDSFRYLFFSFYFLFIEGLCGTGLYTDLVTLIQINTLLSAALNLNL